MTITEVLPTLRALNHQDKIRAIQFLANEMANEDESILFDNREHLFISQTDAFDAALTLQKMLDDHNSNAVT